MADGLFDTLGVGKQAGLQYRDVHGRVSSACWLQAEHAVRFDQRQRKLAAAEHRQSLAVYGGLGFYIAQLQGLELGGVFIGRMGPTIYLREAQVRKQRGDDLRLHIGTTRDSHGGSISHVRCSI